MMHRRRRALDALAIAALEFLEVHRDAVEALGAYELLDAADEVDLEYIDWRDRVSTP